MTSNVDRRSNNGMAEQMIKDQHLVPRTNTFDNTLDLFRKQIDIKSLTTTNKTTKLVDLYIKSALYI